MSVRLHGRANAFEVCFAAHRRPQTADSRLRLGRGRDVIVAEIEIAITLILLALAVALLLLLLLLELIHRGEFLCVHDAIVIGVELPP